MPKRRVPNDLAKEYSESFDVVTPQEPGSTVSGRSLPSVESGKGIVKDEFEEFDGFYCPAKECRRRLFREYKDFQGHCSVVHGSDAFAEIWKPVNDSALADGIHPTAKYVYDESIHAVTLDPNSYKGDSPIHDPNNFSRTKFPSITKGLAEPAVPVARRMGLRQRKKGSEVEGTTNRRFDFRLSRWTPWGRLRSQEKELHSLMEASTMPLVRDLAELPDDARGLEGLSMDWDEGPHTNTRALPPRSMEELRSPRIMSEKKTKPLAMNHRAEIQLPTHNEVLSKAIDHQSVLFRSTDPDLPTLKTFKDELIYISHHLSDRPKVAEAIQEFLLDAPLVDLHALMMTVSARRDPVKIETLQELCVAQFESMLQEEQKGTEYSTQIDKPTREPYDYDTLEQGVKKKLSTKKSEASLHSDSWRLRELPVSSEERIASVHGDTLNGDTLESPNALPDTQEPFGEFRASLQKSTSIIPNTFVSTKEVRNKGHTKTTSSRKKLLSRALDQANRAISLDNDRDFEGAITAYATACTLLQGVLPPGHSEEEKLSAISVTYRDRITRLQTELANSYRDRVLPKTPTNAEHEGDKQAGEDHNMMSQATLNGGKESELGLNGKKRALRYKPLQHPQQTLLPENAGHALLKARQKMLLNNKSSLSETSYGLDTAVDRDIGQEILAIFLDDGRFLTSTKEAFKYAFAQDFVPALTEILNLYIHRIENKAEESIIRDNWMKSDHPDGNDGESKIQDTEARNSTVQTPKPDRKPLTSKPTTKLKAQNQAAQLVFRERIEKHLQDLEETVEELEKASEFSNHEYGLLRRAQIDQLQVEVKEYPEHVALKTSTNGSSPTFETIGQPFSSSANRDFSNNFNFEFPKFSSINNSNIRPLVPLDLIKQWQEWIVREIISCFRGQQDQIKIIGPREIIHGTYKLPSSSNLLPDPESPRQRLDPGALQAIQALLLEDGPFEAMCEDIKDMSDRYRLKAEGYSETDCGQESIESETLDPTREGTRDQTKALDTTASSSNDKTTAHAPLMEALCCKYQRLSRTVYDIVRPVGPGLRRIRWRCECGEVLVVDVPKRDFMAFQNLVSELDKSPCLAKGIDATEANATGCTIAPSASAEPPRLQDSILSSSSYEDSESLSVGSRSDSSKSTGATSISSSSSTSDPETAASILRHCTPQLSFLELCINQGENVVKLNEIHLRQIQNDGALFKAIRKAYYELRGFRRWLFLLKPVNLSYIKFCIEERQFVGILAEPSCPSSEAINGQLYGFEKPCMPKEVFLHYLNSQKEHRQRKWLSRLPTKLKTSIHLISTVSSSPRRQGGFEEALTEGWGIRIVEGPNRSAIFWATMFVAAVAMTVSVAYLSASGDVQGATGICGSIAALWALLMPAFYLKWSIT